MGKIRLFLLRRILRGSWIVLNDAKNDGACEAQLHVRERARAIAMLTGIVIELMHISGQTKEQMIKTLSKSVEIHCKEGKGA